MDRSDEGSSIDAFSHAFPRADALPPYAFVLTEAAKSRVVASGADLIDLGLGNPDRAPRQEILDVLHAHAAEPRNYRYYPGPGLPELRRAVSRWYARRYQVELDPESEVVVCLGAKEGISHFCFATLAPGDVVVAPDPCYPIHVGGPRIAGADVEPYAARLDVAPADAVAAALERVKARGVRPKLVIANYPQNPTGRGVTREELHDLVRVVQRSSAMLLHDLAYADVDFRARFAPSIFDCGVPAEEVKRFAVEVYSVSKSYNVPGFRVAFVVGNARMVGALSLMKSYLDYGGFVPLQHAAAWALDHGDAFAGELRDLYRARAAALVGGLRSAGFHGVTEPTGAMFVWAPLPEAWRERGSLAAAIDAIERAHVAASPGAGFGPGGEGYLRFALIEDEPRLHEASERLRRWISG